MFPKTNPYLLLSLQIKDIDNLHWRPVWVEHFLQWCHSRELPVDFVSCHPYPTDWALDTSGNLSKRVRNLQATPRDLAHIRRTVSESPYPSAEIHLTEWNSSPSSRDHAHDEVPVAVYIVRTMLASLNLVDTIAYWTFTDIFEEEGAGTTPFRNYPFPRALYSSVSLCTGANSTLHSDGGFGLINVQGIPKPTFHAFRLLYGLGTEVLQNKDDHGIVTRHADTGLISAILFHYPSEVKTSPPPAYLDRQTAEDLLKVGTPQKRRLMIENLQPETAFRLETLSPGRRGDAMSAWRRLGSPSTLDRKTAKVLLEYASSLDVRFINADSNGVLVLEEDMVPWTLICVSQLKSI